MTREPDPNLIAEAWRKAMRDLGEEFGAEITRLENERKQLAEIVGKIQKELPALWMNASDFMPLVPVVKRIAEALGDPQRD